MAHYFAMDGNFGDAHGLVVIDTDGWSDDDWQEVEEATDSDRLIRALENAEKYS